LLRSARYIENVGKRGLDRSGKYSVNENDEGILRAARIRSPAQLRVRTTVLVIAMPNPSFRGAQLREPGISRFSDVQLHIVVRCFASPRNDGKPHAWLATVLPSAACAAASLAIGTR